MEVYENDRALFTHMWLYVRFQRKDTFAHKLQYFLLATCRFNFCEDRHSSEDFEWVVVQIITRVHDPECDHHVSRKRACKTRWVYKKKLYRLVERIYTALAIQLRKRDSSALRRGTFISPLKESAAINERSERKSNWEIPAARTVGPFAGSGDIRGPDGRPTKSTYIHTVARKHLSSDTALPSLLTPSPLSLLIVAINGVRLINCAAGP